MEDNDLSNINISIEQILAAIVNHFGTVEITTEELLSNYSNKNLAVTQDPETAKLRFELADNQTETE
jgi:hypothetical protein